MAEDELSNSSISSVDMPGLHVGALDLDMLDDDEELGDVDDRSQVSKFTQRSNRAAATAFREFLQQKNESEEFENFSVPKLAKLLSEFYTHGKRRDGEAFKISSLESFRYSLSRYLKAPPFSKTFDIMKDVEFLETNRCFNATRKELKKMGKGTTTHFQIIGEFDRQKLYTSVHMDPTSSAWGLANKVQFDIRLYFCRCGVENMHKLPRTAFEVRVDNQGNKYVVQVKGKKARLGASERGKGLPPLTMPEERGSPYCPVKSFETYISKLNTSCDRLWQYPREPIVVDHDCWFAARPMGHNTLSGFMPRLSKLCGLSKTYTNHSIKVTGNAMLSRLNLSLAASHIMCVSVGKNTAPVPNWSKPSTVSSPEGNFRPLMPKFDSQEPTQPIILQVQSSESSVIGASPQIGRRIPVYLQPSSSHGACNSTPVLQPLSVTSTPIPIAPKSSHCSSTPISFAPLYPGNKTVRQIMARTSTVASVSSVFTVTNGSLKTSTNSVTSAAINPFVSSKTATPSIPVFTHPYLIKSVDGVSSASSHVVSNIAQLPCPMKIEAPNVDASLTTCVTNNAVDLSVHGSSAKHPGATSITIPSKISPQNTDIPDDVVPTGLYYRTTSGELKSSDVGLTLASRNSAAIIIKTEPKDSGYQCQNGSDMCTTSSAVVTETEGLVSVVKKMHSSGTVQSDSNPISSAISTSSAVLTNPKMSEVIVQSEPNEINTKTNNSVQSVTTSTQVQTVELQSLKASVVPSVVMIKTCSVCVQTEPVNDDSAVQAKESCASTQTDSVINTEAESIEQHKFVFSVHKTGSRKSVDKTGSGQGVDITGSKESVDKTGSKESVDKTGSGQGVDITGSRESVDKTRCIQGNDKTGNKECGDKTGSKESIDKTENKECVDKTGSRESFDKTGNKEYVDKTGSRESVDKTGCWGSVNDIHAVTQTTASANENEGQINSTSKGDHTIMKSAGVSTGQEDVVEGLKGCGDSDACSDDEESLGALQPLAEGNLLEVTCGQLKAILHRDKFYCPGIHRECIEFQGMLITPKTFSVMGEKAKLKDWKNAVRINGIQLRKYIDSGILTFANHESVCTGRCMARASGARGPNASRLEELENFKIEPGYGDGNFLTTMSNGEYMQLQGLPGGSKIEWYRGDENGDDEEEEGEEEIDIKPDVNQLQIQMMEAQNPVSLSPNKVTSNVVTNSSQTIIVRQPNIVTDSPSSKKPDMPDVNEEDVEDRTLWKGIVELGLVDEFFREIKAALDVLKNGMIRRHVPYSDSRKISVIVKQLGLMQKLKYKLEAHQTDMERQRLKLDREMEELQRKVREYEHKKEMLKRKSECFEQLLDITLKEDGMPPAKQICTNPVPTSMIVFPNQSMVAPNLDRPMRSLLPAKLGLSDTSAAKGSPSQSFTSAAKGSPSQSFTKIKPCFPKPEITDIVSGVDAIDQTLTEVVPVSSIGESGSAGNSDLESDTTIDNDCGVHIVQNIGSEDEANSSESISDNTAANSNEQLMENLQHGMLTDRASARASGSGCDGAKLKGVKDGGQKYCNSDSSAVVINDMHIIENVDDRGIDGSVSGSSISSDQDHLGEGIRRHRKGSNDTDDDVDSTNNDDSDEKMTNSNANNSARGAMKRKSKYTNNIKCKS